MPFQVGIFSLNLIGMLLLLVEMASAIMPGKRMYTVNDDEQRIHKDRHRDNHVADGM